MSAWTLQKWSWDVEERSGRPSTSKTDENINKVREMLINNRKLIIRELAEDLNIAYGHYS